ncbi:MAG: VanZ family protein [Brumimicrobium sp.]|nr:VanZ family protein [Brumimicrobium sp.]
MFRFILPSILWTIFVIFISVIPGSNFSNFSIFEGVDKVAHFLLYTFLSLFWIIGLKRQNISDNLNRKAFRIGILGSFLLSFILEIIQEFYVPFRFFELLDLIANGIGCIFGWLIFKIIYRNCNRI